VGLNDGFFSLVFEDPPANAVVPAASGEAYPAFDTQAIARAAAALASGQALGKLGKPCAAYETRTHLRPVIEENLIKGSVIYIDNFENAVTNISRTLFDRIRKGRRYEIYVRGGEYHIDALRERYHQEARSNMVALFNAAGMLEVGISQGNAASLIGLGFGDTIRVEFR
jgi:S-adenosylmethionine hydrolase